MPEVGKEGLKDFLPTIHHSEVVNPTFPTPGIIMLTNHPLEITATLSD